MATARSHNGAGAALHVVLPWCRVCSAATPLSVPLAEPSPLPPPGRIFAISNTAACSAVPVVHAPPSPWHRNEATATASNCATAPVCRCANEQSKTPYHDVGCAAADAADGAGDRVLVLPVLVTVFCFAAGAAGAAGADVATWPRARPWQQEHAHLRVSLDEHCHHALDGVQPQTVVPDHNSRKPTAGCSSGAVAAGTQARVPQGMSRRGAVPHRHALP
jgi:hypothetical protein